jgi:hypothetical protein
MTRRAQSNDGVLVVAPVAKKAIKVEKICALLGHVDGQRSIAQAPDPRQAGGRP